MDVWLDSGVVHHCLPALRPGRIPFPADVYLEGSDQHRGWFHSSLLASVAGQGVPPYRQVVTHGFTVDDKGRKMSKSLGNVVAPQKVMQYARRRRAAAVGCGDRLQRRDERLRRDPEAHVGQLPAHAQHACASCSAISRASIRTAMRCRPEALLEIDRWALARAGALQQEVIRAYRNYDFHLIYQKVHDFCVMELGAFWLDILKDRLYTMPAASAARRSAQTAMYHVAEAMVRWLAPILSFTAEEIWKYPARRARRVRAARDLVASCRRCTGEG